MQDRKQDQPQHDQPLSKPDPETLHTTDPQEHMSGPISSTMQNLKENAEELDHPQKQHRATEERASEEDNRESD